MPLNRPGLTRGAECRICQSPTELRTLAPRVGLQWRVLPRRGQASVAKRTPEANMNARNAGRNIKLRAYAAPWYFDR